MSKPTPYSAFFEYPDVTEMRPGMYFGSHRVDVIRHHLDGWRAHKRVVEEGDNFADRFFDKFHGFVERHYGDNRTTGWDGLILANTSSAKEGCRIFMSLLRQFALEFSESHPEQSEAAG